ncbi:MAG: beta-glucosidase BglX [Chloroherpetonaceae bacterium]
MNYTTALLLTFATMISVACSSPKKQDAETEINRRVDSVLALMTLEEKVMQVSQTAAWFDFKTKKTNINNEHLSKAKMGLGSFLMVSEAAVAKKLQEAAMQSRLKIPLIFGFDVIHGYRTTFPIPLAESCTWDTAIAYQAARIAAIEASSAGINWTFAPMVDIARDARWGRIIEGAGEDPYLGAKFAAARVRGFQGDDLSASNTIAACVKHFAAYGAAEGGRDYNTVDISERTLREIYFPPFKAAVAAGAQTVMTSFNEVAGVPSSISKYLLTDVLRKEWKFNGFVVSDWESIDEVVAHGAAKDYEDAAQKAIAAGLDMDMEGESYPKFLVKLVQEKKVSEETLNQAVRNILRVKFRLGLFDNPFKYIDEAREKETMLKAEHRASARNAATKSIVLLKNENDLLPLTKSLKTVAVVGALATSKRDMLGEWEMVGMPDDVITPLDALKSTLKNASVLYAKGYELPSPAWKKNKGEAKEPTEAELTALRNEAVAIAKRADVIIAVVGETADITAEAHSRADIGLPRGQEELLKELHKLGKPVVMVMTNGRPLAISWAAEHLPAIVCAWHLGVEAGNAIADVLFGDANPTGKLTVTFPRSVGQIPIYYNHKNTGRPSRPETDKDRYKSKYVDLPDSPLYPFGYGLSYTTFEYSDLKLSKNEISKSETLTISVTVKNTGKRQGVETAQLYLRQLVGTFTRPVRELKGFQKVELSAGEAKTITYNIGKEELATLDKNFKPVVESGVFEVYVGSDSRASLKETFMVK